MEFIFMTISWIAIGAVLVAILTALVGIFVKNDDTKNRLYAISAKSILIFALVVVVSFLANTLRFI